MDIRNLSEILGVAFVFILFVVRAFYFALVAKVDPINTVIPRVPFIVRMLRMKEGADNAKKFG